jgi:hypothetical protein
MNTKHTATSRLGLVSIALVLGLITGERLGAFTDSREPSVLYQSIVKGRLSVQTDAIDGACPSWPNDNIRLSSPIVTDGKNRGFPLGSTDLYESDLAPDEEDGTCYYYEDFDVLLSPTGNYELNFTTLGDIANEVNTFRAKPKPFFGGIPSQLEAHSVWWYLTTIDCPAEMTFCLRDIEN